MPVGYAPAQGFDARVYQNLGASEAASANRDYALRASALAQEAGNRSSQLALQREEFEASQQPSQRDYFRAGEQQNEQAMQIAGQMSAIDLRAKYDSLALTQAEEQRMGRLNRQADYVRANTGPGKTFNQQDGQAMLAELYTGINPMQRRQQEASIALTQAQTQGQMEAHARDAAQQVLADNFRAQALPNGTVEHKDENGQTWAITHPDGRGGFHTVIRPRQQGDTSQPRPLSAAQTAGFRRSAEMAVARDPDFIGKPPAERAREVERRFQDWTRQPGAENLAPPRPIELPDDAPLSRLPADQRGIVMGFNADEAQLLGQQSVLNDQEKSEARQDLTRARQLFRQFGQANSMPAQERSEFLGLVRRLDQLTGRVHDPMHPNGRPGRQRPAEPPIRRAPNVEEMNPLEGIGSM